jgi:hypothetical protein
VGETQLALATLREQLALDHNTVEFMRGLAALFVANQGIISDCTQQELRDLFLLGLISEAQYGEAANRHFDCTIALNLPRIEFVEEKNARWSATTESLPGCVGSGATKLPREEPEHLL